MNSPLVPLPTAPANHRVAYRNYASDLARIGMIIVCDLLCNCLLEAPSLCPRWVESGHERLILALSAM